MEQTNFQYVQEIIGQAIHELIIEGDEHAKQAITAVDNFISLAEQSYIVIQWPDSQELMEKDWFEEEAILDVSGVFGPSAYFIPLKRIL